MYARAAPCKPSTIASRFTAWCSARTAFWRTAPRTEPCASGKRRLLKDKLPRLLARATARVRPSNTTNDSDQFFVYGRGVPLRSPWFYIHQRNRYICIVTFLLFRLFCAQFL